VHRLASGGWLDKGLLRWWLGGALPRLMVSSFFGRGSLYAPRDGLSSTSCSRLP